MSLTRLLTLCVMSFVFSFQAQAQGNTDGMTLLGMAEFTELRRPYYIAAFYSDVPSSDSELILQTQGRRRMEMRVTANRWSPRRFSQQWTQAVLINNPQEQLLKFDDNFVQFNSLLNESFVKGDVIVIDAFEDGSSSVKVNGIKAFDVARPGFLELLLGKWIGSRPPSTDFKNGILGGLNAELEASFLALEPVPARIAQTERWFAGSVGGVQQRPAEPAPVVKPQAVAKPSPVVAAVVEPVVAQPSVEEAPVAPVAELSTDVAEDEAPEIVASEVAAVIEEPIEEEIEDEVQIDPEVYKEQQETLTFLYQSSVAKRILRNVSYPKRAVKREQQDSFQVAVTVDRLGTVISVNFVKESRYSLLNKAALAAIEVAGNMPPVPPSLDGDQVEVIVPFAFRLQ